VKNRENREKPGKYQNPGKNRAEIFKSGHLPGIRVTLGTLNCAANLLKFDTNFQLIEFSHFPFQRL
jgi:hypothetical protein